MGRLSGQDITPPPAAPGKSCVLPLTPRGTPSRRLLLPRPASLVMVALILAGCSQQPTPLPQITPPPQATSTPTPSGTLPQPGTSLPTQTRGVSGTSYVAYASGLASTFTKGDICSLAQPFVLEGDALPVSSGLIANFTPTSSTQGNYSFTNNILDGQCVDTSSGTYGVTFYTPDEGDIIMTGVATRVCDGVTTFSGTTEFRVAIRAAPDIACP